VAYIEFFSSESVNKAIGCSGKEIEGNSLSTLKNRSGCKIRVQPSQAEKNRAAAAAK
jgi:hypothetical protein